MTGFSISTVSLLSEVPLKKEGRVGKILTFTVRSVNPAWRTNGNKKHLYMANRKRAFTFDFKQVGTICISLIVVILIISALAVITRIFSSYELLFQIIAVVLSVIFTAIVTNSLLSGQTDVELDQQKKSKVFERKLTIYQEFLAKLCDVIKDGEITQEEAIELEFQTSFIAMHMTQSEDTEAVVNAVKEIVEKVGASSTEEDKNKDRYKFAESLFTIVSVFKKDLYSIPYNRNDGPIKKVEGAFDAIFTTIDGQVDNDEINEDERLADGVTKHIAIVIKRICEQVGGEWRGEIINEDSIGLVLHKGDRSALSFYLRCDPEYFFQLHIEVPERDYVNVYDPFKWKFGGRRNKWCWWQYLAVEYRNRSEFLQLLSKGDEKLIQYLVEKIVARLKYVDEFCELYSTVDIPLAGNDGMYSGWRLAPAFWYRCIAFDRDDSDKTCFDVRLEENGSYSILLFNRTGDEKALRSLVGRLGGDYEKGLRKTGETNKFEYAAGIAKESVVKEVKDLIERIG